MKNTGIENELLAKLKEEAKRIGKKISWFKFAVKTKHGYRFLPNKELQWKKLEKIAEEFGQKYPQYKSGQIVDILSQLVNHLKLVRNETLKYGK